MLPKFKLSSLFGRWTKNKKQIQRNVLETEVEIARLLKRLQDHLVIMTASFPGDPENYNTSIIKMDYKNRLFYLDELIPRSGDEQLREFEKIQLRTRLDGAILTMDCKLKESNDENGVAQHIMYFPTRARSIQRRESYRVSIPLTKRYQVNMQTEAGLFIAGFLNDISYSGVAIRLETPQEFYVKVGENIPFLTLHLDETLTCEMDVRRIYHSLGNIVVCGRLLEVTPTQQRIIQKFIAKVDREKRRAEAE